MHVGQDQAGVAFWNERWANLPPIGPYEGPVYEQHPLIEPYIRNGYGKTLVEIGCVPGNWLVYYAKEFGYRVSGIDYSDQIEYTRANLAYHEVPVDDLIHANFFEYQPTKQYDVVYSGGFAEHFADHRLVVEKHVPWMKPGGLMVMMIPNLTGIHRFLCSTFDNENYRAHVPALMYKTTLRKTLEEAGLEVLFCGFQTTFRPFYPLPKPVSLACRAVQKALRVARLDSIPNQFASPTLISVSRRPL